MNRQHLFIAGMIFLPLTLVAAVCGSETTRIENTGGEARTGVTVAGEGKVTAEPDLALVTLGISTLRPTVAEARDRAAEALDAMITSMRNNGVDEKDIQTNQLSIHPEYDYRNDETILRGFRVTNTVIAKIRNIDNTSQVIDDAVAAGGDDVRLDGIMFTIDDPTQLRDQAREAAVRDARSKADTLARAAGVSLGNATAISEGQIYSPPIPYDLAERAAADSAGQAVDTPIQPGELDVIINVTVTWEIQ